MFTASICNVAFIDVYGEQQDNSLVTMYYSMQIFHFEGTLTTAVQSISTQLVPGITAADKATNCVSTTVFTATMCNVAFIDVYGTTKH